MAAVYISYNCKHYIFHCHMIAHGITYRNSSMHTIAKAYHAFTNNVNIVCACMHSRVFIMHKNCPIMGNSFYMNSFWGPLKLNLPRTPKMLRPAVPVIHVINLVWMNSDDRNSVSISYGVWYYEHTDSDNWWLYGCKLHITAVFLRSSSILIATGH